MPGYGVRRADQGTGLLPWAEQRLIASRNYWVVSAWPDGRPHAMPDPAVNASFIVRPVWGFGLTAADFTGSPTKWDFAR
jgi:hypothetical protein